MSIGPVMSGFLSSFIGPESHDKAGSPNSKILEYAQVIFTDVFPELDMHLHWLDKSRLLEQTYFTVAGAGLLPAEWAKETLCRFTEEQLQGI